MKCASGSAHGTPFGKPSTLYAAVAYDLVLQSIGECGAFYEMFEINEEAVSYRPWFATASAYVITAVNEMLLQAGSDGRIALLPCIPEHTKDVKFKLSAHGAVTVELEMVDRVVKKLVLCGSEREYTVELPANIVFDGNVIGRSQNSVCYTVKSLDRGR